MSDAPAPAHERWRVVALPGSSGAYTQLREAATALGVEWGGSSELALLINGTPAHLELTINSGVVVGLTATVKFEGPEVSADTPFLELTPETATHKRGKDKQINREVQTLDTPWDQAVYVDSDAADFEVKRVLSKPGVRAAIRSLLDGGASAVRISPRGVRAKWDASPRSFHGHRVVTALQQLREVAAGGAPRVKGRPRRGTWFMPVVLLAFIPCVWLAVEVSQRWPAGWAGTFAGAFAGAALALALRRAVAGWVSGDSGSYARYLFITTLLVLDLSMLGIALLKWVNGAGDRSAASVVEGEVLTVSGEDEDTGRHEVRVRWDDGRTESLSLHRPPLVGERLSRPRHPGLLGFRWTGKPRVVPAPVPEAPAPE